MVSPEAEAIRTRVKQLSQATFQLTAPLPTRGAQYEALLSRGHLPPRCASGSRDSWDVPG